jgi:three-Cys-motif partner protein
LQAGAGESPIWSPKRDREFFEKRQGAAFLKHALLGRWARIFASMTGSTAPEARVVYVDPYAGPGTYKDGSEGSPAIAIDTAELLGELRYIDGIFVEKDPKSYRALKEYLDEHRPDWIVLKGDAEEHVDDIFELAGDEAPMLAFLDPFGLGLSFDSTVRFLRRSEHTQWGRHERATEVLLNISLPGLRRNCGKLNDNGRDPKYLRARATILDNVDMVLGGDWWRDIWLSEDDERVEQILDEYVRRLTKAAGYGQGWVPRTRVGSLGRPTVVLPVPVHAIPASPLALQRGALLLPGGVPEVLCGAGRRVRLRRRVRAVDRQHHREHPQPAQRREDRRPR